MTALVFFRYVEDAVVPGIDVTMCESSMSRPRPVVTQTSVVRHGAPGSGVQLRISSLVVPLVLAGYALDDFDPTLESPQVAIWLGGLVGFGFGIAASSVVRVRTRQSLTGTTEHGAGSQRS